MFLRWTALAAMLISVSVFAAEPVRQVGIYVQPFYAAARTPGGTPRVAVGKQFDALLSSSRQKDILAARDLIVAEPQVITPMTMMVLAIRLYDVGLRDDAVFWFYVAKERYLVMADVVDTRTQAFAQVNDAVRNFATLAGPFINSYAFCDLAKQQETLNKAVVWVEANPYQVMFMERIPALPGDRNENHKRAIANAKERAAKARAHLTDAKNRDAFYATRKANDVDAKFCWQ